MRAALIYPHQLFSNHPAIVGADLCVIVEEPLLFTQYRFHAQKLLLHRASMQSYATRLREQNKRVYYVESQDIQKTGDIATILSKLGVTHVQTVDPCDNWLQHRLVSSLRQINCKLTILEDPHFFTPRIVFEKFVDRREKLLFKEFYTFQRKRLRVLLTEKGGPVGGKWSYDAENRKKLPRNLPIPSVEWPQPTKEVEAARDYIIQKFPEAIGDITNFCYPTTHEQANECLDSFLEHRFSLFGEYEDSIHAEQTYLFHSVLTPPLNCGLISPQDIIDKALQYGDCVSLNSLEGFVRQVIGWREYMRGVYMHYGSQQRTCNFWGHHHAMPQAFYNATTGIDPVDAVIRRVEKQAYCHHIERLMVLGNFMLLCEIEPDAIYQWFMEYFIDAYDWVMVPNVYGMSQHADGGRITTKPYISGSSYILKMSNFSRGSWCAIWDALYWRFIARHREFFTKNPRMSVMVAQCDRMGSRLAEHLQTADTYLQKLHSA